MKHGGTMKKEETVAQRDTRVRNMRHDRENRIAKRMSGIIIGTIMAIVVVIGLVVYNNITYNLEPYNKDDKTEVKFVVNQGATIKSVANKLEEMKLIRSATLFNYYVKMKDVGLLQAGNYKFSPSMTYDDIIAELKSGGVDTPEVLSTILVREGELLETIATTVGNRTPFAKEEFMDVVKNQNFINEMVRKYPRLLTSMSQSSNLKYALEGYLFPATYDYNKNDTLKMIVEKMIRKMDEVMAPYYEQIEASGKTVHQVLTIASLAEREGVTTEDRRKIVSVFDNRVVKNMPLQSDITVLYALGVHKELVTYADLEVDSPYNLYKHVGYGPGPFNSPSEDAIKATLNPEKTDYLFFVADIKTGKVYYSKTLDEHNVLVKKYVNGN